MTLFHLAALVQRWGHVLRPPEFRLLVYLHRAAAGSPDGVVGKPREEIAAVTKIPPRNIRPMLKGLAEHEAIEVLSLAAEKTVVRLVKHGSSLSPAVPRVKPVDPVATIKQLVLRMTGQRPGLEDIRKLESDAGTDEKGLLEVLREMLDKGDRYQSIDDLKGGVFDQLRAKKPMYC